MKPAVARHGRGASAFGGGPGRSSRGIDGRPRRQIDPGTAGPIKDRILLKLSRPAVRSGIGPVRLVDLQHARWPGRLRSLSQQPWRSRPLPLGERLPLATYCFLATCAIGAGARHEAQDQRFGTLQRGSWSAPSFRS
jgi:hypothetical protein